MLPVLFTAALAAEPEINVTWKNDRGLLLVRAPTGEHLAPDAPFDVEVEVGERAVVLATLGDDGAGGVPLGDVRGQTVKGLVRFSLCEDAGSRCRLVESVVAGDVPTSKRGTVVLPAQRGPARGAVQGFPARVDARRIVDAALASARTQGLPVLLDFGAIWCPPCQRMDAELFLADPRPSVVDAFVLARVDVDDPSSWPLKDRYLVTGYPTVLAIDPDGTELGRQIGYPGLDAAVTWLDAIATGRLRRQAGDPSAAEAGPLAWQAVQEDRLDDARRLVALGAGEADGVEFRLARFHLAPTVDDALWLAERAPGRALAWVGALGDAGADARAREAAREAVRHDLVGAKPGDVADLLWAAAELADDPVEARLLYAACAAQIRGRLTGEALADKGWWHDLALATERGGDPAGAAEVLRKAAAAWPTEPTFWQDLGRLELRHQHADEALAAADRALESAWGDNRLTVAIVRAQALVALQRTDEARRFVKEVLDEQPAPNPDVDVRAHRYREQLRAVVDGR